MLRVHYVFGVVSTPFVWWHVDCMFVFIGVLVVIPIFVVIRPCLFARCLVSVCWSSCSGFAVLFFVCGFVAVLDFDVCSDTVLKKLQCHSLHCCKSQI